MSRDMIDFYYRILLEMSTFKGLTIQDYLFLKEMLNFLDKEDALSKKIRYLIFLLEKNGRIFKYSADEIHYFQKNAYLLPLVMANNSKEISLTSDNSYLFWCQFEEEEKPLMSVTDCKNQLHCFGCGQSFNAISYLQNKEGLSFYETLKLLSEIYLFDDIYNSNYLHLIYKYQASILSPMYARCLTEGLERFYKRGIKEVNGETIDELYKNRFSTIMRVRRKEVDVNFKRIQENRRVVIDANEILF